MASNVDFLVRSAARDICLAGRTPKNANGYASCNQVQTKIYDCGKGADLHGDIVAASLRRIFGEPEAGYFDTTPH
jgi:hypothetical protein